MVQMTSCKSPQKTQIPMTTNKPQWYKQIPATPDKPQWHKPQWQLTYTTMIYKHTSDTWCHIKSPAKKQIPLIKTHPSYINIAHWQLTNPSHDTTTQTITKPTCVPTHKVTGQGDPRRVTRSTYHLVSTALKVVCVQPVQPALTPSGSGHCWSNCKHKTGEGGHSQGWGHMKKQWSGTTGQLLLSYRNPHQDMKQWISKILM